MLIVACVVGRLACGQSGSLDTYSGFCANSHFSPSPFHLPPLDHEPKVPEGWLGRLFLCDGFEAVSKEQRLFLTLTCKQHC